ncbi:alpha-L-fucosidase [Chitinophaga pendula]|uniref:alpha-L-fucosidase n=1 Tax=Chitinophaga TaxID=79328 RepID=UPI000BAF20C4|nr:MULTISPECIES: alpha-L-fucosidase [Chitinophaga]ASZ14351.1 alpha-L-fucosidase [Chitinophaga sp. MD30]UCJ08001.1 alpha-L-fucosidase [Chitinophaga pendula]
MKKNNLLLAALLTGATALTQAQDIKPYGALPSKAQLQWQDLEYYMFIHFGPNTFTDKEWGHGDEDPKIFNPSQLDAQQWARTAKAAGMKGIIITAKHHDGFCLWPSKYSTHTVRESSWKEGKGDVLAELSAACKANGLKFGVYLSPWDRNHPKYGTPEYNQIFANTLTEVLSNYGEVFEQWFDGANGEGPGGKKQVYDWPLFHSVVYKLQPQAVIFSDVGPGCRWVGNENGIAGKTNWSTLNVNGFSPGAGGPPQAVLNAGNEDGEQWIPAECDVSIRPGWFYSAATDDKVKSVAQLLDIYYASVGRNGSFLLNVPVDRRGLIHANDSTRLMELRRVLDASFKTNLALRASVTASNTRTNNKQVSAAHLTDGNNNTYWATKEGAPKADITLETARPVSFNRIVLQEYLPLGQRVKSFVVEVWENGSFKEVARETTIGHKRILRLPALTAAKVRVRILDAKASPVISEIQLYKAPEVLERPTVSRDRMGTVTISCTSPDPVIRYTTDGSEPTATATIYKAPFALPAGGTVKAKSFIDNGRQSSETSIALYDIAPATWSATADGTTKGHDAAKAIDGDPATFWQSGDPATGAGYPHELQVDLGNTCSLKGFAYTPSRQAHGSGTFAKYAFYVSQDGKNWNAPVVTGTFDNIRNNPVRQEVKWQKTVTARYIKLVALQPANEQEQWATVAELEVITK